MRYQIIQIETGVFPVLIPNSIMDGDGFYVSFNDHDVHVYGGETTALVVGQMEKFFILKGDHRAQYAALINQGLEACRAYFKAHLGDANKYSDKLS